jgi:hypothetical protein
MQLSALTKGLWSLAADNLRLPNGKPLNMAGPCIEFEGRRLVSQFSQVVQRPAVRATTSGLLATTVALAPTPPAKALTLSPGFGQLPQPKAGYILPESLADTPLDAVVNGADDPVKTTVELANANVDFLSGKGLPVVWSSEATDLFSTPEALKTLAEEGHVRTVLIDAWAVGDEPLIKAFMAAGSDANARASAEVKLRQRLSEEGSTGPNQDVFLDLLKAAQQAGVSVHGLKPTTAPEGPDAALPLMHETVADWGARHPGEHALVLVAGERAHRLAQLDPTAPWPSLSVEPKPLPLLSSQLLRQAPSLPGEPPRPDFMLYQS